MRACLHAWLRKHALFHFRHLFLDPTNIHAKVKNIYLKIIYEKMKKKIHTRESIEWEEKVCNVYATIRPNEFLNNKSLKSFGSLTRAHCTLTCNACISYVINGRKCSPKIIKIILIRDLHRAAHSLESFISSVRLFVCIEQPTHLAEFHSNGTLPIWLTVVDCVKRNENDGKKTCPNRHKSVTRV